MANHLHLHGRTPLGFRLPLLVVFAAATPLFLTACDRVNPSEDPDGEPPVEPAPVPIRVAEAKMTTLRPSVDLVGTISAIPERSAVISSRVAGLVEEVLVVEGQAVKAGEVLVRLDARMAQTRLAAAQAAVDGASADLELLKHGPRPEEIEAARQRQRNTEAVLGSLRSKLEATQALYAKHDISAVAYEQAKSRLNAAEADRAEAEAQVRLLEAGSRPEAIARGEAGLAAARAALQSGKLDVAFRVVGSPIDGTVTELPVRRGMYVDSSMKLAAVVDLSTLFAHVRVPTHCLSRVKEGGRVDVSVPALPDVASTGTIARLRKQAGPRSGDIGAFATIPNAGGMLRPGLACRVRLWLPEVAGALAVPVAAIADRDGTPVVTVIRDNKAYETEVALGVETREAAQITGGLAVGDLIATEGGYALPEGCPVRIIAGP